MSARGTSLFNPGIYAWVERIPPSFMSAVGTTHFKLHSTNTLNKKFIKDFRIAIISTIFAAMRRVIPLLFILLLSAPFLGMFSWLKLEKHAVRKSIKHKIIDGIDHDLLVHKSFAKEDTAILLNWEHTKEFSFQGEMYDIVSRVYTDDSVSYTLWWDNEETQLNRKLEHLTNNLLEESPEKNNKSNHFGFVVKHFFCTNKLSYLMTFIEVNNEQNWHYLDQQSQNRGSVDSPPPKRIIHNG